MNTDAEVRRLARLVTKLQGDVETLTRASQARYRSVEGGSQEVYDEDGTLRQVIGQQEDGTYTVVDVNGAPPPEPLPPTVTPMPGVLVVSYDGGTVEGTGLPADFARAEVHVSTVSPVGVDDDTEVADFTSPRGGTVTLALPAVEHFVVISLVNTSGEETGSVEVSGTPQPAASGGGGGVATYNTPTAPLGLTAADDGALWYDTSQGNLPHRWDGDLLEWVAMPVGQGALGPASVTDVEIVDEAVTAAKLEQDLVLSSRIIGGDPAGARAELNAVGLQAYDANGVRTFNVDGATGDVEIIGQFQTSDSTKSRVEIGQATSPYYTSIQVIEFEVGDDIPSTSPGQVIHGSADQVTPGVSDTMATFLKTGYFANYAEALIELNSANSQAPSKMLLQAQSIFTSGACIFRQTEFWHYVGAANEPAYQNGWGVSGAVEEQLRFRLDVAGNVHIQGRVAMSPNDNTVVFTLPVGYRPSNRLRYNTLTNSAFGAVAIVVDTDGTVTANMDSTTGSEINLTLPPFYVLQ